MGFFVENGKKMLFHKNVTNETSYRNAAKYRFFRVFFINKKKKYCKKN